MDFTLKKEIFEQQSILRYGLMYAEKKIVKAKNIPAQDISRNY